MYKTIQAGFYPAYFFTPRSSNEKGRTNYLCVLSSCLLLQNSQTWQVSFLMLYFATCVGGLTAVSISVPIRGLTARPEVGIGLLRRKKLRRHFRSFVLLWKVKTLAFRNKEQNEVNYETKFLAVLMRFQQMESLGTRQPWAHGAVHAPKVVRKCPKN